MDNYEKHQNGRIWIFWNPKVIQVQKHSCTDQMIHCRVCDLTVTEMYWLTAIYAHNQLENRKRLWTKLADIHKLQTGPWMLLGDYNNVLKSIDRIGGRKVTEAEHRDLTNLMKDAGLHEMDIRGQHFTWSNNQGENAIYSRIDRLLGNTDWFQQNLDCTLTVMHLSVSDHALLCLEKKGRIGKEEK